MSFKIQSKTNLQTFQEKNVQPLNSSTPRTDPSPEFHLYRKLKEEPSRQEVTQKDTIHNVIQSTWSHFNQMSDTQRHQLLRGLISQCSSKQIDFICTLLNFKTVDETSMNHASFLDILKKIKKLFASEKEEAEPQESIEQSSNENALNSNIYIKLLNSHIDPELIPKQIVKAGPKAIGFAIGFLSTRCKRLQSVLQTMHDIAIEVDVVKSMSLLLTCILDATEAEQATIYFTDLKAGRLSVRASTWLKENQFVAQEKVFAFTALAKGETVNVYNIKSSEYFSQEIEENLKNYFDVDCIMSTPIFGDGMRVSGIIEIMNKKVGNPFFNAEDEFLLKVIASMGTLMFNHANVKQSAAKKTDDIKVFLNTASIMSSSELDMGDLINVIMSTAQELVGAERCTMFLIDEEKEELWSRLARGSSEIRFPMRMGIAGHVAMTGEILNIPDAYSDSRFNRSVDMKTGYRTRNILCLPMRNAKGAVIGVTQVINKLPETAVFTKDDEQQLSSFSALAAVTIEKSQMFKALHETLEETNKAKSHLQACLNSSQFVLMTLDHDGKMSSIVHPEILLFSPENIKSMKLTSYEHWLGPENPELGQDIGQAFKSTQPLIGRHYRLKFGSKSWMIHYFISKLKEDPVTTKKESSQPAPAPAPVPSLTPPGVSIYLEILDEETILNHTMGRYLLPQQVHQLAQSDERLKLKGNISEMTLFSANILNFHQLMEVLDPKQVIDILNQFYALFTESIDTFHGIVDKYSGDSISAIFGVPFATTQDPENAIHAALLLKQLTAELNTKLEYEELPMITVGIGISTEGALSGMVGTGSKWEFTVVGDAFAVPKRLQDLTKIYGISILVDEETRSIVKDIFHTREVDMISVKGFDNPVTAFEIMGSAEKDLAHDMMTTLICYELGLSEYRARNWQAAMMHFKKAITLTDDKPARTFVDRCKAYIDGRKELPPNGWDGVFTD